MLTTLCPRGETCTVPSCGWHHRDRADTTLFTRPTPSDQVEGTTVQRDLAKLAIAITLQQRNGGKVHVDFDDLGDRKDVSTFDVPKETVGFLLGAKGPPPRVELRPLMAAPTSNASNSSFAWL